MDEERRLRRLRRASGATQFILARKTHVSRSKIADAESGRARYTDAERKRILAVLVELIDANIAALSEEGAEEPNGQVNVHEVLSK